MINKKERKSKLRMDNEITLKELEKLFKPSLILSICGGLILLGPYLHLYLIIAEKNYQDLLKVTIATGITLPLFALNWAHYFYNLKHYKKDAKEFYEEINEKINKDMSDSQSILTK